MRRRPSLLHIAQGRCARLGWSRVMISVARCSAWQTQHQIAAQMADAFVGDHDAALSLDQTRCRELRPKRWYSLRRG